MYPIALEYGINDFWDLTYKEIVAQLRAKRRVKEEELRTRAYFDYAQSQLFMYSNDPKKLPKAEKMYPFLKAKDESKAITKSSEESVPQWQKEKMAMMMIASRMKQSQAQKAGDVTDGSTA